MPQTLTVRVPTGGQEQNLASVVNPLTDLKEGVEDLQNGDRSFEQLNLVDVDNLEISSGAITVTQTYHQVDTEGSAASDELTMINGGTDGDVLVLLPLSAARDVKIVDGTGNIRCGGNDIILKAGAIFIKDNSDWVMISNAMPSHIDGVPIGADTPSSGVFTNLSILANTFLGFLLTGDGQNSVMRGDIYRDASNGLSIGSRFARGSVASQAAVQSGDRALRLVAEVANGNGTDFVEIGKIDYIASENASASQNGGRMVLGVVSAGDTSITDVLRIENEAVNPADLGVTTLGTAFRRWGTIYGEEEITLYNASAEPSAVTGAAHLFAESGNMFTKGTSGKQQLSSHLDEDDSPIDLSERNSTYAIIEESKGYKNILDVYGALEYLQTLSLGAEQFIYEEELPLTQQESWIDAELNAMSQNYDLALQELYAA
jgi:hypothetical protein